MPSADKSFETRIIIIKTILILVAVTVNSLEFFIPRIPFLPWLKPGFANCVTLYWIIRFGGRDALLFSFLRTWMVGFYFGFSFVTLAIGLSGSVFAIFVMTMAWHGLGRHRLMGTVGVAILGAAFHNFGQIIAVYFLLAYNSAIFYQIPFMIMASVCFGGLVGMLTILLARFVDYLSVDWNLSLSLPENETASRFFVIASVIMVIASVSLMFVSNILVLSIFAVMTTGCAQWVIKGDRGWALFLPLRRFWMMFVFVACFQLFPAYGKKLEWIPFLSREGVWATLLQWLRLWCWLQFSFLMTHFKFHTVIFKALAFFFRSHGNTFYAGLLALENFPGVFDLIRKRSTLKCRSFFSHPVKTASQALHHAFEDVAAHVIDRQ